MARRLAAFVYVVDDDGVTHGFGPADVVPSWAKQQITNPDAWADADDEQPSEHDAQVPPVDPVAHAGGAELAADEEALRRAAENDPPLPAPEAPPRAGQGSGREAWAAHAALVGVVVSDDMGRDDIIEAVDAVEAAQT